MGRRGARQRMKNTTPEQRARIAALGGHATKGVKRKRRKRLKDLQK